MYFLWFIPGKKRYAFNAQKTERWSRPCLVYFSRGRVYLFGPLGLLILGLLRLLGRLGNRVRVALPLQLPGTHELVQDLVRGQLALLLELGHVFLEGLDGHLLQLAGEQLAALVALVDLLQLGVVFLEVGQVDVRDVDVGVAA